MHRKLPNGIHQMSPFVRKRVLSLYLRQRIRKFISCYEHLIKLFSACLNDCPCGENCPVGCGEECDHPLCPSILILQEILSESFQISIDDGTTTKLSKITAPGNNDLYASNAPFAMVKGDLYIFSGEETRRTVFIKRKFINLLKKT